MMHASALQSCITLFCFAPIENNKASGETHIMALQRGYAWTQPVLQQTGSRSMKPSLQPLNHHWAWLPWLLLGSLTMKAKSGHQRQSIMGIPRWYCLEWVRPCISYLCSTEGSSCLQVKPIRGSTQGGRQVIQHLSRTVLCLCPSLQDHTALTGAADQLSWPAVTLPLPGSSDVSVGSNLCSCSTAVTRPRAAPLWCFSRKAALTGKAGANPSKQGELSWCALLHRWGRKPVFLARS